MNGIPSHIFRRGSERAIGQSYIAGLHYVIPRRPRPLAAILLYITALNSITLSNTSIRKQTQNQNKVSNICSLAALLFESSVIVCTSGMSLGSIVGTNLCHLIICFLVLLKQLVSHGPCPLLELRNLAILSGASSGSPQLATPDHHRDIMTDTSKPRRFTSLNLQESR